MANDLDKKVSKKASKAFNSTFNFLGALVGLVLGGKPSTRRSRPSSGIRRRSKRW